MFDGVYQFLESIGYPHPIHPTEVHMPIGLIVAALIFHILAPILRRPTLVQTARHCTILAAIFLVPTMIFGFMDWQHFYHSAWLFPIEMKLMLAAVLIVLVIVCLVLSYRRGTDARLLGINYAISFLVVVALGYYGGNLVYGGQRSQATDSATEGQKVFNNNCAACHPKGGNAIDPSLPLAHSVQTRSLNAFVAFIRNPRRPDGNPGAMPPFSPASLSDQQAEELYKYVTHILEGH